MNERRVFACPRGVIQAGETGSDLVPGADRRRGRLGRELTSEITRRGGARSEKDSGPAHSSTGKPAIPATAPGDAMRGTYCAYCARPRRVSNAEYGLRGMQPSRDQPNEADASARVVASPCGTWHSPRRAELACGHPPDVFGVVFHSPVSILRSTCGTRAARSNVRDMDCAVCSRRPARTWQPVVNHSRVSRYTWPGAAPASPVPPDRPGTRPARRPTTGGPRRNRRARRTGPPGCAGSDGRRVIHGWSSARKNRGERATDGRGSANGKKPHPRAPHSSSERSYHRARAAEEKVDWLPAPTARVTAFAEKLGPVPRPPFSVSEPYQSGTSPPRAPRPSLGKARQSGFTTTRRGGGKGDWLPPPTARVTAFAERLGPGACPPFP